MMSTNKGKRAANVDYYSAKKQQKEQGKWKGSREEFGA